jgi:hypothetical protein
VLPYNTEVRIVEAREDPQGITPAYVWGRIGVNEWMVFFRILPDGQWWARATVGSAEICVADVPNWPDWLPIPPELTVARPAFGFHEKSPQDTGDMNAAFDALTAGGERVAVKSVETMGFALAHARGGEGYYRPWNYGDCGDVTKDPIQEADRRAEYVLALSRGLNTTYFEVDNECPEYLNFSVWFNRYSARLLNRLQGLHLIFPTQGPGYWEPDDLRAIVPTLDLILAQGVCFGYHAYGVTPGVRVVDSGIWLGFRHRQIRQWLIEIDRRYVAIPICATEVGTGAGGEFQISDFVEYNCAVQNDQYLRMVAWWTSGQWFGFTLNGQMAPAARAFVAAPCRRPSAPPLARHRPVHGGRSAPLYPVYTRHRTPPVQYRVAPRSRLSFAAQLPTPRSAPGLRHAP